MRHHVRLWTAAAALVFAGAMLWARPVAATHQQGHSCDCNESICSSDGFKKTLTEFSVDQLAGTSSWTYEICSPGAGVCAGGTGLRAGQSCTENAFCRKQGQNTDPGAFCTRECAVDDFKDLSHVDIVLPGIGDCVTDTQQIQISQLGCPSCDPVLSCSASDKDPSCDITADRVLKCDIPSLCSGGNNDGAACKDHSECPGGSCSGNNLDPGECVKVKVTIAGENPSTGPGAIAEVDKSGPNCVTDQICGPSCGCGERRDGCLTRTAGFWGNHPHITELFLPVTVCGNTFTSVLAANSCATCKASAMEALCISPGVESNKRCDSNPAYQQLVRQLTAAKLNLAATAANGGNCGPDIVNSIAQGEALCGANQKTISGSGIIQGLDAFNNSQDTLALTPPPFDSPGPADPTQCKAASGNGWVSGKNCPTSTFPCAVCPP